MPEDFPSEFPGADGEGLEKPPSFFPQDPPELGLGRSFTLPPREDDEREPVRVALEGVYKSEGLAGIQHFVRLESRDRLLSIVIGGFEAQAILLPLQDVKSDRPMTHDLVKTFIDRFGAQIASVTIDDLWNDVYYARIHLEQGKGKATERFTLDARPSDAIAMAVRYDAPIYIAERVFEIAEGYEDGD